MIVLLVQFAIISHVGKVVYKKPTKNKKISNKQIKILRIFLKKFANLTEEDLK